MKKNVRDVFKYCSNYDEVINFKYKKDDFISRRLIDYYYDYLFNNEIDKKLLKKLDCIMFLYVSDKKFYSYMQDQFYKKETDLEVNNYYREMIDEIFEVYELYNRDVIVSMTSSNWL